MKCPHCNYEHGWSGELMECVIGKDGDFFKLSNQVKMTRSSECSWQGDDNRELFACPSCLKTFISEF